MAKQFSLSIETAFESLKEHFKHLRQSNKKRLFLDAGKRTICILRKLGLNTDLFTLAKANPCGQYHGLSPSDKFREALDKAHYTPGSKRKYVEWFRLFLQALFFRNLWWKLNMTPEWYELIMSSRSLISRYCAKTMIVKQFAVRMSRQGISPRAVSDNDSLKYQATLNETDARGFRDTMRRLAKKNLLPSLKSFEKKICKSQRFCVPVKSLSKKLQKEISMFVEAMKTGNSPFFESKWLKPNRFSILRASTVATYLTHLRHMIGVHKVFQRKITSLRSLLDVKFHDKQFLPWMEKQVVPDPDKPTEARVPPMALNYTLILELLAKFYNQPQKVQAFKTIANNINKALPKNNDFLKPRFDPDELDELERKLRKACDEVEREVNRLQKIDILDNRERKKLHRFRRTLCMLWERYLFLRIEKEHPIRDGQLMASTYLPNGDIQGPNRCNLVKFKTGKAKNRWVLFYHPPEHKTGSRTGRCQIYVLPEELEADLEKYLNEILPMISLLRTAMGAVPTNYLFPTLTKRGQGRVPRGVKNWFYSVARHYLPEGMALPDLQSIRKTVSDRTAVVSGSKALSAFALRDTLGVVEMHYLNRDPMAASLLLEAVNKRERKLSVLKNLPSETKTWVLSSLAALRQQGKLKNDEYDAFEYLLAL